MTAHAVAALPPVEPLPAPAANVVEQGQHGRFLTFLAAAPRAAEHHAARAATRALGHAKTTATDDSAAAADALAAAAAAQAPAQTPAAAASAPASGSGTASNGQGPLPASPTLAAATLAGDAAQTVAVPPPGAITLSPAASTQPDSSDTAPATQSNASATAAATPIQSMAASLGLRLVAGAPNLIAQPPRTPLASLTGPRDKTDAAAPTGSHPALALELLQGSSKSAADPTTDAAVKLIDAAAKDIIAAAPTTPATTDPAPSTTDRADTTASDAAAAQLAGATSATAAPASPAAASAATALPLMAHAVAEQVAIGVRQAVKGGADHIQIQLQPAELGAIAVKLNVNHDGRVTMVVSADRSDTLNLLQQDAGTLAQALRDAGLQADNSSLSFNLRGFQMNQQTAQGGSPWRDAAPAGGGDDLGAVASVMPTLRRHSGALDIHV
jgi:flagellar hook-length control protein FliK